MVEMQPRRSRFRRARWVAPAVALGLAALSAGLGLAAQAHIFAQPDHEISFVVDEGLPYGITQESVDAVAATQAFSYEPFTVMVVGRDLTWDEYNNGEMPDGIDVMLSVGFDESDVDLVIADATRASVAKLAELDDWMIQHRVASDMRETYINNLTQGLGPSAVVGAALTAASGAFDGSTRSPVFWISLAALPLLAGLLVMLDWAHNFARERGKARKFSRARLHLARVVLELELLEARVLVAGAELDRATGPSARKVADGIKDQLESELAAIRDDSLKLAQEEQLLTREILNQDIEIHEPGAPAHAMALADFAAATDALRRRTNGLIAASSLRVGHSAGGDVLGQLALATTLPLDDLLKRDDLLTTQEARVLHGHRSDLLALVSEAETAFGTGSSPETIVAHSDLLARWRQVEQRIATALAKTERRLKTRGNKDGAAPAGKDALARRVAERAQVASGGTLSTMAELRASLDLTPRDALTASEHAERVLLLVEAIDGSAQRMAPSQEVAAATRRKDREGSNAAPLAVGLLPLAAGVIAGIVAISAMAADDKTYGKTLTGDEPLAALHVVGDPTLLPDYVDDGRQHDEAENIDTLTLAYVRDAMERATKYGDKALLPEPVELFVTLLPIADYVEVKPLKEDINRIEIDYFDLLAAYPRIKAQVAAQYPDAIDPALGEVRPGKAILPLWIAEDGSYGTGLPLTSTLSTGVDSRLGAYYFEATQPLMLNRPDDMSFEAGWIVADQMSELGRQMEYNNLRKQTLAPAAMFWTVALATWAGAQAVTIAAWSIAQLARRGAGTRSTRRALRELREQLNKLALGLDLSMLDAVAVLGSSDGHGGKAAEADQHLYESMLLTAWREVQELESLPRRLQRGPEWRARVERMRAVITTLAERDTAVADRAMQMIRSYS
ncbi:hypothetical protein GCM10009860_00440 [Microbacterium mitrae]|uniref:DUF5129 domain-containing protein n=1 Tax=Microbacterium mitrae TaxID=664640 RepID=A0A5C8HR16_9MICO|nr:hypothetical protein [Microbacterium mitrae]TXK05473.1 hypothetical protein FVP60_00220 [Microbacterium mitrae]